jgi:hypothetical protein
VHSRQRGLPLSRRDRLPFIANSVDGHDPAARHEEVKDARIQFAHVPQLKQPVADRFG